MLFRGDFSHERRFLANCRTQPSQTINPSSISRAAAGMPLVVKLLVKLLVIPHPLPINPASPLASQEELLYATRGGFLRLMHRTIPPLLQPTQQLTRHIPLPPRLLEFSLDRIPALLQRSRPNAPRVEHVA